MDRGCSVEGCERKHCAKGYCKNHYYVFRVERCTVEGCNRAYAANGMCKTHWRRQQDAGRTCSTCGTTYTGDARSKYCSPRCKWRAQRHPLRNALEDGDTATILPVAEESSVVTSSGCWEWQYATNGAGYGMLGQGGSAGLVHRLVLEAAIGRPLGAEPVHHKCANRRCVNPAHLQLVSHRENMAEMLTRTYLVKRVEELESALRVLDPNHQLVIGLGE